MERCFLIGWVATSPLASRSCQLLPAHQSDKCHCHTPPVAPSYTLVYPGPHPIVTHCHLQFPNRDQPTTSPAGFGSRQSNVDRKPAQPATASSSQHTPIRWSFSRFSFPAPLCSVPQKLSQRRGSPPANCCPLSRYSAPSASRLFRLLLQTTVCLSTLLPTVPPTKTTSTSFSAREHSFNCSYYFPES
jgi:hypothetical protein